MLVSQIEIIKREVIETKGLKKRRLAAGLSQKDLAERLGIVQSAISAWESGEKMPRASQLPALAFALRCTIDDLYREEDAPDGQGQQAPPAC